MKLGFGLYKHMLNKEHYNFARQCGATHVVIHLVDYFNQGVREAESSQPLGGLDGWGYAGGTPDSDWSLENLNVIKKEINESGLELEAIENFDPAHWHDILLDGPSKEQQISKLKQIITQVGQAGIPTFGYNFSLAGVCGRITTDGARGHAETVGMDGLCAASTAPIKNGMVWNMVYDQQAEEGDLPKITHDELWQRLTYFLKELIPVAEKAGVRLAAHPDDPPLSFMRQQPRLVYQPDMYQRLLDIVHSPSNSLEFCLGTLAEMSEGDIYEICDRYTRQNNVAYIHFRNVRGKVPHYQETFIDEGDIDMSKIITILKKNKFDGVLIPDHTPQMSCKAPWHAGMAYAMGYMKAQLKN